AAAVSSAKPGGGVGGGGSSPRHLLRQNNNTLPRARRSAGGREQRKQVVGSCGDPIGTRVTKGGGSHGSLPCARPLRVGRLEGPSLRRDARDARGEEPLAVDPLGHALAVQVRRDAAQVERPAGARDQAQVDVL